MNKNIDQTREQLDDRLYEGRYGGPDICPECNRNYGTTQERYCSETMDRCDAPCVGAWELLIDSMPWWKKLLRFWPGLNIYRRWANAAFEGCSFKRYRTVCQRCNADMGLDE